MTGLIGLDVQGVQQLGNALKGQAQSLHDIMTAINGVVEQLQSHWDGPDAQEFRGWWEHQHRVRMAAVAEAVAGLGTSAMNNASEQDQVSGPGGSGIAIQTVGTALTAGTAGAAIGAAAKTAAPPSAAHAAAGGRGPQGPQNFMADEAAKKALSEVGTVRPTGWDQEGECVKSVQRWINDSGGHMVGGGVVSSFQNSGAVSVSIGQVQVGDVLQYTSLAAPDDWIAGVHTVMVTGLNADGTYHIVQSNFGVPGKVTEVPSWTPNPPKGFEARVWRFGKF